MKMTYIPAKPKKMSRIGVYCRVSTTNESQYGSLENQISHYKNWISKVENWTLVDIYADRASGKSSNRPEFQRMLQDCHDSNLVLSQEVKEKNLDEKGIKKCIANKPNCKKRKKGINGNY